MVTMIEGWTGSFGSTEIIDIWYLSANISLLLLGLEPPYFKELKICYSVYSRHSLWPGLANYHGLQYVYVILGGQLESFPVDL